MCFLDKYFAKIAWVLIGICFAAAGAMMLISGSFHLDQFYDAGEVYDVAKVNIEINGNYDIKYDDSNRIYTIQSERAAKVFWISKGAWKYVYMNCSKIDEDGLIARLVCYDADNMEVYQDNVTLLEGDNLIFVPDVKYSRLNLNFYEQPGKVFCIEKVQFRERFPIGSKNQLVQYFLMMLLLFLGGTGIVWICIRKKVGRFSWYAPVNGIQTIFLHIGKFGEKLNKYCSKKTADWIQRGIFCSILLYMQICYVLKIPTFQSFRYYMMPCVMGIIIIAFLCWEKPLKRLNWNNGLVGSWFCLWILAAISDLIVEKRYMFIGYVMIFAFGFLFFMWGNMEGRERLLKNFIRGIEWSFLPNLMFCYLFRPYQPLYRYSGSTLGPGYFGMYLLFVWIAFLTELDFDIRKKSSLQKDVFCIFILGICANLLWRTQTMSALIPVILTALIFSFKLWRHRGKVRIFGFALYVFLFGMGYLVDGYCIYHIPRQVNAEIRFEKDIYAEPVTDHPFTLTVQAEEVKPANRILEKLQKISSLEKLTTGRTLFWKAYLRELNLWGHKSNARFWGAAHMPHNGLLAIMYRYGIFSIVPYFGMLLYGFCYAWRYFKRHLSEDRYSYFVLANTISCYLLILVENIELPFCWVWWYALYIVMGIYFDDEKTAESLIQLEIDKGFWKKEIKTSK